jgi:hypothetical protein
MSALNQIESKCNSRGDVNGRGDLAPNPNAIERLQAKALAEREAVH